MCSCTSVPQKAFDYSTVNSGKWHAKVNLTDRIKNKDYNLDINFKALREENKTRLDVYSFLGIHVASIVVEKDSYQALLMKKKEYRSGASKDNLLASEILGVELDTRILPMILFDQANSDDGWSCNVEDNKFLLSCDNTNQEIKINWIKRDGVKKQIEVISSKYSMKVSVDRFVNDEALSGKSFQLPIPKGFRKIN